MHARQRREYLRRHRAGRARLHRQASGHCVPRTPVLPAWVGSARLAASAATRRSGRGDGDLQPQRGPEHGHVQQQRSPPPASAPSRRTTRSSPRAACPTRRPILIEAFATGEALTPNPATDLFMNSGDVLSISIGDSPNGLLIHRSTTRPRTRAGSMTASAANGFAQILYEPTALPVPRGPVHVPPDVRDLERAHPRPVGGSQLQRRRTRTRSATSSTARPCRRGHRHLPRQQRGRGEDDDDKRVLRQGGLAAREDRRLRRSTRRTSTSTAPRTRRTGREPGRGKTRRTTRRPSCSRARSSTGTRTTHGSRSKRTCRGSRRRTPAATATGSRARTA